jgi:protein gp37
LADGTHIEWTDATWNPVTGCAVVSPGCTNCYAMKLAGTRLKHIPSRVGLTRDSKAGPVWTGEVRFNAKWLTQPLKWKRPRRIFVCAHGDLFAESVKDEWIDQVFAVMALCPQHTFQVLTKRPERMRAYLSAPGVVRRIDEVVCDLTVELLLPVILIAPGAHEEFAPDRPRVYLDQWPLPNVWLGVSAEDQKRADERIPVLLDTPAAVRFVSLEPLLGAIDLKKVCLVPQVPGSYRAGIHVNALAGKVFESGIPYWDSYNDDGTAAPGARQSRLDWVIVGGESGVGARPMHPDWARALRDQCAAAGVPFFFKQWGRWTPGENVERQRGVVETAHYFGESWHFTNENLARDDGHRDDEPDLYSVGKTAAGRLLDGLEHNGMPT